MPIRKKGQRGHSDGINAVFRELPVETVKSQIVTPLATQGFCVINGWWDQKVLNQAVQDTQTLERGKQFVKFNSVILDGLLGCDGSSKVAELKAPAHPEVYQQSEDGTALRDLDTAITHIYKMVAPHTGQLGFDLVERTAGLVHLSGPDDDRTPSLTENAVLKWTAQFTKHRLMVIIFLGPESGILELNPYETIADDVMVHEVSTIPGMVVVLRPDVMSHQFFAQGHSVALTSFFLSRSISNMPMTPAARELDDWTVVRLKELKDTESRNSLWDPSIPREFQTMMNHMFNKGQHIGVCGVGFKFPTSSRLEEWPLTFLHGPDLAVEIENHRWNHADWYDDRTDCHQWFKTYNKHAVFMSGLELFDTAFFSIARNEAASMDPHQRLILEVGYESLFCSGMKKKTLLNAPCSVYLGFGGGEWSQVPKEASLAHGATSNAPSIASGRFSYTFGIKGQTMTLGMEAAAGLTAIYLAAESCQAKGRVKVMDTGLAMGASLILAPYNLAFLQATSQLSREGRCFTYDTTADGYIRGDGCGAVTVRCMMEKKQNEWAPNDSNHFFGSIAGSTINNSGKSASLTSPHGPSQQEAIVAALRCATISPLDVDSVEAHAAGALMADAVEVGALTHTLRKLDDSMPLCLTAGKGATGNMIEAAGCAQFLKIVLSARWGIMSPMVHLREANPNLDFVEDEPVQLPSELLHFRAYSCFQGCMAIGIGGTNASIISWGQVVMNKDEVGFPEYQKDFIAFWPGGGGALADQEYPQRHYTIIGSWDDWTHPTPMEFQREGVYSCSVTLGACRWEAFQILLDGDMTKALHPGYQSAYKDAPVFGPDEDSAGNFWVIDDRVEVHGNLDGDTQHWLVGGSVSSVTRGPSKYRVHLRIAGRWRSVDWEKILDSTEDTEASRFHAAPTEQFYVCASWTEWDLVKMVREPSIPGLYTQEVELKEAGGWFQIVRNKDRDQVMYPYGYEDESGGPILGPDDLHDGRCWFLDGQAGEKFRLEFQIDLGDCSDQKQVSWRRFS